MTTYNGRCHCGEVEWTVKLEQSAHVLCHCNACKSLSGGPSTLNQVVPQEAFQLTKGTLNKYTYKGDSGSSVHCYYCPTCTTHAYHHQEFRGPHYVVRTILLDGGKDMKPAAEVYGRDRLDWISEVATTFETVPPS